MCARALADGTSPAKRLQTEEFLGQQASNRSLLLWLHKCILYIAYLFFVPHDEDTISGFEHTFIDEDQMKWVKRASA